MTTEEENKTFGTTTEFRFFQAFQASGYNSPYWFRFIRKATPEEDLNGVDAFAELDTGTVPIQIKSSHAGRLHDIERYGDAHCVIVIPHQMYVTNIRDLVFNRLYIWRQKALNNVGKRKKRRAR